MKIRPAENHSSGGKPPQTARGFSRGVFAPGLKVVGRRRKMGGMFALSLKQPWATLLARGRKTVEVRRWPTARRGRVLIHAARVPDARPEAWRHVSPELLAEARVVGGIIGVADLTACVAYRTRDAFALDQERHLNDLSWYEGPVLYGFTFANAEVLPFRRYAGWMRFFEVKDAPA